MTFLIPLLFLFNLLFAYQTQAEIGFGSFGLGVLGVLGSLTGIILWIWGFISLGKSFSVLPKAKKLQTTGIYKYFCHPIYMGIGLSCLGIAIALGSWPGLIYAIFIVIPLNIIRAKREEKVLMAKFGQKYFEYQQKTIF